MQPNSEKQVYTTQNNNYSSEGASPPYQTAPPSYSEYPQQPIGGAGYAAAGRPYISQPPLHQQKGVVVVPIQRRQRLNTTAVTPITTSLRVFLLLSGFLYALWGIIAFSFQLAIAVNSYSTNYQGFWTGPILIVGGILMMVVGFRPAFPLAQLIRMHYTGLTVSAVGLIVSIINYSMSNQCTSTTYWYCDDSLISNLKISLVIIFGCALIHTILNMVYISKQQKQAISTSIPNIPNC